MRHSRLAKIMMLMGGGASAPVPWYLAGGVDPDNCLAAYQPIGAASLAASYVNLISPGTNDASAPVAAPTHAVATGWTFDGSTQFLSTGIPPDETYSCIVRFASAGTNGYLTASNTDSSATRFRIANSIGDTVYYSSGSTPLQVAPGIVQGVIAIAGNKAYRNGVHDGDITTSIYTSDKPLFIGAKNNNGTADLFLSCAIQAYAIYNTAISAPQVAAVTAAMAALTG